MINMMLIIVICTSDDLWPFGIDLELEYIFPIILLLISLTPLYEKIFFFFPSSTAKTDPKFDQKNIN